MAPRFLQMAMEARLAIESLAFKIRFQSKKGISIEGEILHASCPEKEDGAITIMVDNFSQPYDFLWSTGDTSATIEGLGAGVYFITVSTSDNKTKIDSFTIEDIDRTPPIISLAADTFRIQSCVPFSYPIPTAADSCGNASIELFSGSGSNRSFSKGIHEEIYLAIDDAGNTSLCTLFVINEVEITIDKTIENIPCFSDSFGTIEVNISGDHAPFDIMINEMDSITLDSLLEGQYVLSVRDASGCIVMEPFEITRPDSLSIQIDELKRPTSTTSGDGSIEITVSGGTPPYSFQWRTEDENFSSEEDLELLFPGSYVLLAEDNNSCLITSDTITLDVSTNTTDLTNEEYFQIIPNPSQNEIYIDTDPNIEVINALIVNNLGQIVWTNRDANLNQSLDISQYLPGVYYVIIVTRSNESIRRSFIKN